MTTSFQRWLYRAGGLLTTTLVSRWMATLDYAAAYYEPAADPAHDEFQGPAVFVFWHEYIPFMFYTRSFCHIAMLVSKHRDAELLTQSAAFMGFETVRGSTQRGGGTALRDLHRKGRLMNLAITPDGPRGPRRKLAPGAVYLASRLQLPLVAIGLGYDRPWRMRTWDRFAIPQLYSRARAIISPKLSLPADLDRDGLEHYRRQVERLLNTLTAQAEAWAHAGGTMENGHPNGRARARRQRSAAQTLSFPLVVQEASRHVA